MPVVNNWMSDACGSDGSERKINRGSSRRPKGIKLDIVVKRSGDPVDIYSRNPRTFLDELKIAVGNC